MSLDWDLLRRETELADSRITFILKDEFKDFENVFQPLVSHLEEENN